MRVDKSQAGFIYFIFHIFFGTLYAAVLVRPKLSVFMLSALNVYLFISIIFMRGALCAWNDNIDRECDRKVYRCRLRPIARGTISPFQGHVFVGILSAAAADFLILLPLDCVYIAIPRIILLALYPFAKRFTDYSQVILGCQISIGITMGSTAMGLNPFISSPRLTSLENSRLLASVVALYASNIAWTSMYDTVYAHQDIKYDSRAGIKSMVFIFGDKMKFFLSSLTLLQVALLSGVGVVIEIGFFYVAITCGGALATQGLMIWSINSRKPKKC